MSHRLTLFGRHLLAAVLICAGPATDWAIAQQDDEEAFRPRVVIPRAFPPITKFPVAQAAEAGDRITDRELVLGVVVNGKARAYPINVLTGPRREIINDTLGNQAIAATW